MDRWGRVDIEILITSFVTNVGERKKAVRGTMGDVWRRRRPVTTASQILPLLLLLSIPNLCRLSERLVPALGSQQRLQAG